MKKMLLAIAALAITTPALVSCSDDNDDIDFPQLTLVTDMEIDFDTDILSLCDVTVTTTNFLGITETVNIVSPDWNDMITTSSFPASSNYVIKVSRKPGVQLTKATYDLDCEVAYEADSYIGKKESTVVPEYDIVLSNAENVPAAQVEAEINRIIERVNSLNFNYTFDKSYAQANTIVPTLNK